MTKAKDVPEIAATGVATFILPLLLGYRHVGLAGLFGYTLFATVLLAAGDWLTRPGPKPENVGPLLLKVAARAILLLLIAAPLYGLGLYLLDHLLTGDGISRSTFH